MKITCFSTSLRYVISLVLLAGFLVSPPPLHAQHSTPPELTDDSLFVSDAKAAVDSLYKLKFKSADQYLESWRAQHPDHPVWVFWDGMELWWRILPDLQNEAMDDSLFNRLNAAVEAADQVLDKAPHHRDALLVKALSLGLMARQYANREKWFKSINQARHAVNTLSSLEKLDRRIPDLMLGQGLLKYYTAYLPEAYPLVKTVIWVLPSGDKEKGIALMEQAAEESIYVRPEALYFLGKIYMNHENRYRKALPYFRQLNELYPRNPYYARQYIRALIRSNQNQRALARIDKMLKMDSLPYQAVLGEELLAWKGRMLYRRNKLDTAQTALLESYYMAADSNLARGKNRPFHVMAGYYLGKVHEKRDEIDKALYYYRSVADADPSSHYADQAARRVRNLQ